MEPYLCRTKRVLKILSSEVSDHSGPSQVSTYLYVCVGVPSVHTCVCRRTECAHVCVGVPSVHTCV